MAITTATTNLSSNYRLVNKIKAINTQQVEDIARNIIAQVMDRLVIDIFYAELRGETSPDINGKLHPVYWTQYIQSSTFLTTLLPIVKEQISQSFSKPNDFLEKGVKFTFISENSTDDLASRVTSLQKDISEQIKGVKKRLDINSVRLRMILKVNRNKTADKSELNFDVFEKINGATTGHAGGDLKHFEKFANKSMV